MPGRPRHQEAEAADHIAGLCSAYLPCPGNGLPALRRVFVYPINVFNITPHRYAQTRTSGCWQHQPIHSRLKRQSEIRERGCFCCQIQFGSSPDSCCGTGWESWVSIWWSLCPSAPFKTSSKGKSYQQSGSEDHERRSDQRSDTEKVTRKHSFTTLLPFSFQITILALSLAREKGAVNHFQNEMLTVVRKGNDPSQNSSLSPEAGPTATWHQGQTRNVLSDLERTVGVPVYP